MQFKTDARIIWEGRVWLILFIDELAIVLKPEDSNERLHLTTIELDIAYMDGKVVDPEAPLTKKEASEDFLLSDLSMRQRSIITQRLEFIQRFEHEEATVKMTRKL